MKIDKLMLGAGVDIPFPPAQVVVHIPTIREIAMIGENNFHIGLQLLNSNKNKLYDMDKTLQDTLTNFDIIQTMMMTVNDNTKENVNAVNLLLDLLFPNYTHIFTPIGLLLNQEEGENKQQKVIRKDNYNELQGLLVKAFQLDKHTEDNPNYNPINKEAAAIAKKLEEARSKISALKGNKDVEISVFDHYISILAVGQKRDRNSYNNYTPYQLYTEFERFIKKYSWDISMEARLAGAKDVKEVDNWME